MRFLFIIPIRLYQWIISPLLPNSCRYEPTCSEYMLLSIEEWGIFKGVWLGLKRIGRCNPWGSHGFDPVPKKENNDQKTKKK